jgi:uncharacterized phiE125 gp8 family phage protein
MAQSRRRNRNETGGAAAEPVTLANVKTHLRIDHSNDDDYIDLLIEAATDYTEDVTGRSLMPKTYDLYLDAFPASDAMPIELCSPPLISVTSIKYYDQADVEQTWTASEYVVDTDQSYKGLVYPAINYSWPAPRIFPKAVHIEYTAGYADSGASPAVPQDNIPATLQHAIYLLIGHLYENREMTTAGIEIKDVPTAYDALIANYRVRQF